MNAAPDVRHVVRNPAEARRVVREALRASPDALIADALLLTSEVVTNAMMHAGSISTHVVIVLGEGTVRIEVDDASPAEPHAPDRTADEFVPGGYGVSIVDSIADRWGVESHPGDGKTVWFELAA